MKRPALVAAILAGASIPALASASPFDGTWKLDTAKSKLTGDTFTYSKTATGFHFSNGKVSYDFAIDGKDYQIIPSRLIDWNKAADGGWDIFVKVNGRVVSKWRRTISADGKSMISSYAEYRPDGTTVHESDVYTRVSGSKGLAGEWKETKFQSASDTMKIATWAGGHFEIDDPALKETVFGKTDGSPVLVKGPWIPPGSSGVYKADGPRKWSYEVRVQGKAFEKGVMTVLDNGKIVTRRYWVPGKESEAATEVYVKQ